MPQHRRRQGQASPAAAAAQRQQQLKPSHKQVRLDLHHPSVESKYCIAFFSVAVLDNMRARLNPHPAPQRQHHNSRRRQRGNNNNSSSSSSSSSSNLRRNSSPARALAQCQRFVTHPLLCQTKLNFLNTQISLLRIPSLLATAARSPSRPPATRGRTW